MNAELLSILPELVIAAGGLLFLVLPGLKSGRMMALLTIFILTAAAKLTLLRLVDGPVAEPNFYGMVLQDRYASFFQIAILASMVLVLFGVIGYRKGGVQDRRELYALLLLVTVALMFLVSAQHLALIYIALEMVSLLSYLLTGMLRKESLSAEGGLKYFLFGSLATGTMLYGISLIYGLTGCMDLPGIAAAFPKVMVLAPSLAGIALFLVLIGFAFKVALVPFHMWAPDAYEGAPTPVTAFLAVLPKLAGFAALARFLFVGITPGIVFWPILLGYLSVITMTLANLTALAQTNVKRLLAYSSIAHAGTMTIGLAVATPLGLTAALYYLVTYSLMNMGAFLGVIAVGEMTGREDIGAFAGLSRRQPALAFMMTVALLSLSGIPPLAGFFGKMWVFGAAVKAGAVGLAVLGAVNSVISVFYYMKIVKAMYLDPASAGASAGAKSYAVQLALVLCTIGVFLLGLCPGRVLLVASDALPMPVQVGNLPWVTVR